MIEQQARRDLGTPVIACDTTVALEIDGIPVTVAAGTSIMRAAALAGNAIPRLCATDALEPFGSCRLCLVEIEGRRGYPASCTTPAEDGMRVRTQTAALQKLRRGVMELYISDHPLDCLTCAANGECELQDMAAETGLREVRFATDGDNHLGNEPDASNPYFTYDPSKCIVCNRCVRACEERQGTFALTISGRGFASRVSPGQDEPFLGSECVSCGACVQACPTATLQEKSIIQAGLPTREVLTTCAYCGVGCGFKAELRGNEVVRMTPWMDGRANEGHSCVKGRFAWGYATHEDRATRPMIRERITEPWREVSWQEAIDFAAQSMRRIQEAHGIGAIGGITSSRCTNEETYLVQKLVRAVFGNNNVDTCARVCHSPTGYGLALTLGTSAGTQTFASVDHADVVLVMGANPTDAHPVFASRLKRRVRAGARLIVIDPRRIDLVESPHVRADYHLAVRPGTNVAILSALAHVIVTEGLVDEAFVADRCDQLSYRQWREFVSRPENSPEATAGFTGVPAEQVRGAARLFARGASGQRLSGPDGRANAAIYYGLGVTEHAQGSTAVIAIANLAMATGNLGREGVGVNPLRGQNNVQGSCDMGSFPHQLPGYRHVGDPQTRASFEAHWGVALDPEPGLRIPNMFDAALDGSFRGLYCQGEDIAQSDPDSHHVAAALSSLDCLIVQDIFLNETSRYAHVFLPGSSFLEKDGTFTNAERRISRVRQAIAPLAGYADWEVTQLLSNALGYPMHYRDPGEIMDEIAALTPSFAGVSFDRIDQQGSVQWPCNDSTGAGGTPVMYVDGFSPHPGTFALTKYVASEERVTRKFPLILTTGRILSQYNVGAQTRRTANVTWHAEDVLDIHPTDAQDRGIRAGDWVGIQSRAGETVLRAQLTERMQPGVVYTTFHFPESCANVVTTDSSDWATNCPEYKVTAVQVRKVNGPSGWQTRTANFDADQQRLTGAADHSAHSAPTAPGSAG